MIITANIIDFVAALIQVGSGYLRQKVRILAVQILQLLLQAVSMLLLGGITGAISNVLSCLRNFLCYKGRLNLFWKLLLIGATLVMTVLFNTQGLLGYLPFAVCTVYILLMDIQDPVKFKLLVTLSFLPWVFYHLAIAAYVAAVFDIATVLTNAVTLLLMLRKKPAGH